MKNVGSKQYLIRCHIHHGTKIEVPEPNYNDCWEKLIISLEGDLYVSYRLVSWFQVPPIYGLDGTDPAEWDTKVLQPAAKVVRQWLGLEDDGTTPVPIPLDNESQRTLRGEHICKTCMRVFIGQFANYCCTAS